MPGMSVAPPRGQSLAPAEPEVAAASGHSQIVAVFTFGSGYILISAGLIAFNKYLMHESRFPFAVPLVMLHMALCFVLTSLLYLARPSLFPSLSNLEQKVEIDRSVILKGALPIGIFFAAQLVLSNTAYMHSSMAFLQMMKEANLVLVYAFSVMFSMEQMSARNLGILCAVVMATTMTIHGELNFSFKGFVIQGTSQLFESFKIVLQALLLSNAGRKLDALTYVLLVAPLSLAVLSVAFGVLLYNPNEHVGMPSLAQLAEWWPVLLVNSLLAFTLNVVTALFFKHTSAVAFILAGIVKDAAIVACGGFLFHEVVSFIQVIGFVLQLAFIMLWRSSGCGSSPSWPSCPSFVLPHVLPNDHRSMAKAYPRHFEAGLLAGVVAVATGAKAPPALESGEKMPLLPERKAGPNP